MGLATEARKASNVFMPHTLKPDNHEGKGTARNLWITADTAEVIHTHRFHQTLKPPSDMRKRAVPLAPEKMRGSAGPGENGLGPVGAD